jgi:hypothetical protein
MAAPKMKQSAASDANVRHVAPYPISIQVVKVAGQPAVTGSIVRLTEIGFLMKVDGSQFFKVGETCQFNFELPVIHATIQAEGKIIKTYDGIDRVGGASVKVRTVEVHFKALPGDQRNHLDNYLVQSAQKKR